MRSFRTTIPHKYKAGKSNRKINTNSIMNMHWGKRKEIHDSFQSIMKPLLAKCPTDRTGDIRYRISLGFYAGKSTKVADLDNFLILMKWATDVWKSHMGIDDNFNIVIESRVVYMGKEHDERVVFQVEETMDLVGKRQYI